MPGIRGGAEWSGACVDMETGIMYVGINDIPNIVELKEKKDYRKEISNMPMIKAGEIIYQKIVRFVMELIKVEINLFRHF